MEGGFGGTGMYGIELLGGRAIVHAEGELDQSSRKRLEASLDHVIALGIREVTVDLSRVEFLDSSALSALIGAHLRLHPDGGRLAVRGASARVQRILQVVDLAWLLDGSAPRRSARRRSFRAAG